ncbi:GtrA family protein [Amycolatopsis sp. NPDC059021]|uniref:GtrA family protein n=1 Tax=Amycolatopsis sp. NPDC059021 TaxID=3346704 RepID=UPI00366DDE23
MRELLSRHRELIRFAVVGGMSFVITLAVNYGLKFTVLRANPLTALILATLVATIFSYVANREWSFRTRGGHERTHEAALFFLFSGIALGLNSVPLAVSRYVLQLQVPHVTFAAQEIADFVSGIVLGTLLGTVFRWWAFKKWVFPAEDARPQRKSGDGPGDPDIRDRMAA